MSTQARSIGAEREHLGAAQRKRSLSVTLAASPYSAAAPVDEDPDGAATRAPRTAVRARRRRRRRSRKKDAESDEEPEEHPSEYELPRVSTLLRMDKVFRWAYTKDGHKKYVGRVATLLGTFGVAFIVLSIVSLVDSRRDTSTLVSFVELGVGVLSLLFMACVRTGLFRRLALARRCAGAHPATVVMLSLTMVGVMLAHALLDDDRAPRMLIAFITLIYAFLPLSPWVATTACMWSAATWSLFVSMNAARLGENAADLVSPRSPLANLAVFVFLSVLGFNSVYSRERQELEVFVARGESTRIQDGLRKENRRTRGVVRAHFPAYLRDHLSNAVAPPLRPNLVPVVSVLVVIVDGMDTTLSTLRSAMHSYRNAWTEPLERLVAEYGMELVSRDGESALIVGGIPRTNDDHRVAAVNLALALKFAVQRINSEKNVKWGLRAGLACGPVATGIMCEFGHRKCYDVVGEPVETARALALACDRDAVSASLAYVGAIPGRFDTQPLAPLRRDGTVADGADVADPPGDAVLRRVAIGQARVEEFDMTWEETLAAQRSHLTHVLAAAPRTPFVPTLSPRDRARDLGVRVLNRDDGADALSGPRARRAAHRGARHATRESTRHALRAAAYSTGDKALHRYRRRSSTADVAAAYEHAHVPRKRSPLSSHEPTPAPDVELGVMGDGDVWDRASDGSASSGGADEYGAGPAVPFVDDVTLPGPEPSARGILGAATTIQLAADTLQEYLHDTNRAAALSPDVDDAFAEGGGRWRRVRAWLAGPPESVREVVPRMRPGLKPDFKRYYTRIMLAPARVALLMGLLLTGVMAALDRVALREAGHAALSAAVAYWTLRYTLLLLVFALAFGVSFVPWAAARIDAVSVLALGANAVGTLLLGLVAPHDQTPMFDAHVLIAMSFVVLFVRLPAAAVISVLFSCTGAYFVVAFVPDVRWSALQFVAMCTILVIGSRAAALNDASVRRAFLLLRLVTERSNQTRRRHAHLELLVESLVPQRYIDVHTALKDDAWPSVRAESACVVVAYIESTEVPVRGNELVTFREMNEWFGLLDDTVTRVETAGTDFHKVATRGHHYIAVVNALGGLPHEDAVRTALHFARHALALGRGDDDVVVRVGIAMDFASVGIAGRERVQYDAWGSAVSKARLFCKHARRGTVLMDALTWQVIDPTIAAELRWHAAAGGELGMAGGAVKLQTVELARQ